MKTFRFVRWLCVALGALISCAMGCRAPTRESPWEPAPPTVAATLTSVAQRATATSTPMPTNPIVTPTNAAMPVNGITARLNETFTLGWSQWATLPDANNTRVFFTSILEDTRCALDINCFQAGNVRVAVTVESGGTLRVARFDLSLRATDYRRVGAFNGYLVQFVDIAPARERAAVPIQPIDYRLKLLVTRGTLDATQARVNEPFTLKLGHTLAVANLDTQVTFEAVQQDSRCPARVLCATSGEANVVITLQRGGKAERLTLGTSPANAVKRSALFESAGISLNAITPYPQTEFASKEIAPGEYQITLVIMNFIAAPTPSASRTTCPDLARGDASEILGEPLQDATADLVLFQPVTSAFVMRGVCGYASVAFTPNKTRSLTLPSVSPASAQADYAVIAGKLTDNKRLEQLISIASAIEVANPRGSGILTPKLLTMYAAGAWHRDLLNDFPDAARGATGITVSRVENLGESALWVWREFEGGRYAALVAQRGDTLFVIAALANEQRAPDALRATMTSVLQKMLR